MSSIAISVQDNSTNITVVQNEAIAAVNHYTVNISLSCCTGGAITPQQVFDALNTLDDYMDDDKAVNIGGLALHDLYWVADGSDSNIPGNLRRVTTV
jgi:hypothetical protein